jgi:outer membrane protein OmpA-like peptidoglycan-associated protein
MLRNNKSKEPQRYKSVSQPLSKLTVGTGLSFLVFSLAAGCADSQPRTPIRAAAPDQTNQRGAETAPLTLVDIKSLPDTIGIEHQDRVNRFARLAHTAGIQPPEVDEMQLGAGQVPGFNYPVPMVRVRFEERVFFDFDKYTVRPEAGKVLDLMAENMKRDVPDAQLTVLGHTDAIGSDQYNDDLSGRRAASVIQQLYARGVRLSQMSSVPVGKRQPVAPNSSEEGRAKNRRVEFMISASQDANITLVKSRRVIADWLWTRPGEERTAPAAAQLAVMRPQKAVAGAPLDAPLRMAQVATVQGRQPKSEAEVKRLAPQPDIKLMPLKEFQQAQLKAEFDL